MMRLLEWNDPSLKEVAKPAGDITTELKQQIHSMGVIVNNARAAGLAASQVGIQLRFFVYQRMKGLRWSGKLGVAINPIVEPYGTEVPYNEGCLTFPGLFHDIIRPGRCKMTATDILGKTRTIDVGGLMARVFQHEFDHLNGKLIIDDPEILAKWTVMQGAAA